MSTLSGLIATGGPIKIGDSDGVDVLVLQIALSQAGYRIGHDGEFGPRTQMVVEQFQAQHGLRADGIVGPLTAALLDAPHQALVATAKPLTTVSGWPHDDTASLIEFCGDPRDDLESWKTQNVTTVPCPWSLYYEGKLWPYPIQFHKKAAPALLQTLETIWLAAAKDNTSPIIHRVKNFSGSGEFRPIRGSSRLSCHAFWMAIDFDAEDLPLGKGISSSEMPQVVVDSFKANGAFWGGDYIGRKDPMHFQWAHE